MNLRRIIYTCFFIIIMLFPINTFAKTEIKQIDLSTWQKINLPYDESDISHTAPNWVFNSTKTAVTQTVNARPAILLSNI